MCNYSPGVLYYHLTTDSFIIYTYWLLLSFKFAVYACIRQEARITLLIFSLCPFPLEVLHVAVNSHEAFALLAFNGPSACTSYPKVGK